MIITPSSIESVFFGLKTDFQAALLSTPTFYERVVSLKTSKTEEEKYAWTDLIPALREWTGERKIHGLSVRAQTIVNKKFEDTIGVERTKIEGDLYHIYSDPAKLLGEAAKKWPDQLVFAALANGENVNGYDDQGIFSTAHPVNMDNGSVKTPGGASIQSNLFNIPLSAANYQAVRSAMRNLCGADGQPLGIEPDLLVVPTDLEQTARQILQAETFAAPITSTGVPQIGNGAVTIVAGASQTNTLKGTADVLVCPYLPNSTTADPTQAAWYLMCTKRAIKPMIWQLWKAPEFAYLNKPTDPSVFMLDKYLFGVRALGNAGYGPWWLMAKSTGH